MLKVEQKEIIGIAALLIHAAKIDEIYSEKEKKIIFSFVKSNLNNEMQISVQYCYLLQFPIQPEGFNKFIWNMI